MTDVSSHIESLSLRLQQLGWPLLVLLTAAAVAAAVWYYRTTRPEPEGLLRPLLITLRAAALALLLIGLAEPVLTVVHAITSRETVAVLVDTSTSMHDAAGGAPATVLDAITRVQSALDGGARMYGFDTGVRELGAQPEFVGPATDITGAVEAALKDRGTAAVVLISDGRWNLGEDPAGSALPAVAPVYTVFTGSGGGEPDVSLRSVSAANIGRAGDSLMVELEIGVSGDAGGFIPVTLSENGGTLAATTVSLDSAATARVRLPLPLGRPGDHRYTATIAPERDSRAENNSREFDVQVLKSTFTVLLSAPLPSPDLAFIRRAVEADGAFSLAVDTGLQGSAAISEAALPDTLDAVIVLDGGGPVLKENAAAVARKVSDGTGIWFIGSTPPGPELSPLTGEMPFSFTDSVAAPETGVLLQLTDAGRGHFITAGSQGGIDAASWPALPPLTSIERVMAASDARVLATTLPAEANGGTLPAIIAGTAGSGKTLAIPISGLWRWRLRMAGANRSDTMFGSFVTGCLRWLTTRPDTEPLRVTTGSRDYAAGAEIDFEGRLFDNVFSPVAGAEIGVTVDGNPAWRLFLDDTGAGLYTGTLRGMPSGEHTYHAEAYLDNRLLAGTDGSFTVAGFSLDMLDGPADPAVMRLIAERTGGIAVTPGGIDSLLADLTPSFTSERRESSHRPALNPAFPLIAVTLLAVEWGIRKRRGMI